MNADALLAMAEQLLPAVNLANWKDRATAAQSAGKELRLRELRAVVAASRTVTLDEEGRALAKALADALDQRVTALRDDWVARMRAARSTAGGSLDALRDLGPPPEPSTRLPAELAVRMAEAAGAAMTADTEPSPVAGPAGRRGRVAGATHGEAGRASPGPRGPSGGAPRGRPRARAGQAPRAAHPATPAAARPGAGRAASAQRAVEDEQPRLEARRLESCFVARSPGSATASTSGAAWAG